MISEQNLINLGFAKIDGEPNEDGTEWYFYILDIGSFSFTSSESDIVEDDNWKVYMDEHNDIVIENMSNLNGIINILNRIMRDGTTD
jgi:hypothetical protein